MSTPHLGNRASAPALASLLVCACALITPSVAGAATVTATGEYGRGLTLQAGPAELNTVTTSAESLGAGRQRTTFRDETAPLVAGSGCVQTAPNTVTCETEWAPKVDFLLDDGDDRLTFDSGRLDWAVARGGTGDDVITDTAIDSSPDFAQQVYGDAGNDQLTSRGLVHGGDGADRVEGGPYVDTLVGGPGDDFVFGREGNDQLYGGNGPSGSDFLSGSDLLDGGAGNDTFDDEDRRSRTVQQINSDVVVGGPGDDSVSSYQNRVANLQVDLSESRRDGQSGEGDDLSGVENITGGDGDDELYGDGDANRLLGGAGDDDLVGRGGDDMLMATQGDTASGDRGRDRILIYRDSTGYVRCASGRDFVTLFPYTFDGRGRDTRMAARISKTCEKMEWKGVSFRPTPTRIRPSGLITFGRLPFRGERFLLTRAAPPYVKLVRRTIPAGSFSVQLPRDLVRKHKKTVRVVIDGELLYRFRLGG